MSKSILNKLKAKNFMCRNLVVKVPDSEQSICPVNQSIVNKLAGGNIKVKDIPEHALVFAAKDNDLTAYRIMWRLDKLPFSKWYISELRLNDLAPVKFHEFIGSTYAT